MFSPEEAEKIAGKMLNQYLVTKQTGAAGRLCKKVMVAERKFPRREFYFAVMMERSFNVSLFHFISNKNLFKVFLLGSRRHCFLPGWC